MNPYKSNNYEEKTDGKPIFLLSFIFCCAVLGVASAALAIYLFLIAVSCFNLSIFISSSMVFLSSLIFALVACISSNNI